MSKILVLTSRFPFPLEKGDKLRIYNQLKGLSADHEIHLVALNDRPVSQKQHKALEPFCKSIHVFYISKPRRAINIFRSLFRNIPLQVGLFYTRKIHFSIRSLIHELQPDAIYCHLIRMSEYIREEKTFQKTIDYMDAFSTGMKRRAEISHGLLKPLFHLEYKRLLNYEQSVFNAMEKKIIISSQDREGISHPDRNEIQIVPNGVDFEIFHPLEREKNYDLLFTGNMGYPPNIESAHFAATQILPEIHKTRPGTTLLIAGIHPPEKIKKLKSDRIFVIEKFGHIRDAFAQSRIMLAPMLISIGLQNKILQAMAMKVPAIVSSLANKAIHADPNREIIEVNSPQEFASAAISLLNDAVKYYSIQQCAFDFVKQNFDWNIQNRKLEKIILS